MRRNLKRRAMFNLFRLDCSELARRTILIRLMIFSQTLLMLSKEQRKKGRKGLRRNRNLRNKTKMTFLTRPLVQSN